MKHKAAQWKITDLMALTVFALFAVCILSLLLTGAGVYRSLVDRGENRYAARTAVQYLTTRVRQAEEVYTEEFGSCEALVFPEEIDGEAYLTRVYCYDGWLRELFTAQSGSFCPEDGEPLLALEALDISQEPPLLQLAVTLADGSREELILSFPDGKEAVP